MLYTLEILGKPMGKQRVKFGKGFAYTPKETVNYENYVKTLFQSKYGQPLLQGKVNISLKAYFSIPKSTSKKQKNKMLLGDVKPLRKPDCDNIAKVILDSLNNIAYKDDKQVVSLTVKKFYSDIPKVCIELWEE